MLPVILSIMITFIPAYTIDFSEETSREWYTVNDGVMGGLSQGEAVLTETDVRFYGTISLANNGGFSSLRGPYIRYDLSAYQEVVIKYRSKGIKMAFQMEEDRRFYYPNFKVHLASSEEWVEQSFSLKQVRQYRMGYPTGGFMEDEDKNEIIRVGFITDEKRAGDFEFEVAYVEFR